MGHNIQNSSDFFDPSEPKFFPKSINRNTNHPIISESTYKKIWQSDIYYDTGFLSYPCTTIIDLRQTVKQYSPGAKSKTPIFQTVQNSIDKRFSGGGRSISII